MDNFEKGDSLNVIEVKATIPIPEETIQDTGHGGEIEIDVPS